MSLLCKRKGWGKRDGDGKLPLSSAFADFALIGGGIALLVLGNKVVGPALFGKGRESVVLTATGYGGRRDVHALLHCRCR